MKSPIQIAIEDTSKIRGTAKTHSKHEFMGFMDGTLCIYLVVANKKRLLFGIRFPSFNINRDLATSKLWFSFQSVPKASGDGYVPTVIMKKDHAYGLAILTEAVRRAYVKQLKVDLAAAKANESAIASDDLDSLFEDVAVA